MVSICEVLYRYYLFLGLLRMRLTHGLTGANQMDGPVGITQCGIRPGEKITYRVPIGEQVGTFW
jgi:hypothetical protein